MQRSLPLLEGTPGHFAHFLQHEIYRENSEITQVPLGGTLTLLDHFLHKSLFYNIAIYVTNSRITGCLSKILRWVWRIVVHKIRLSGTDEWKVWCWKLSCWQILQDCVQSHVSIQCLSAQVSVYLLAHQRDPSRTFAFIWACNMLGLCSEVFLDMTCMPSRCQACSMIFSNNVGTNEQHFTALWRYQSQYPLQSLHALLD